MHVPLKFITDNDHEAVGDIQVTNAGGSDDLLEDTSATSSSLEVTVSQGVCVCVCVCVCCVLLKKINYRQ